jgi:hypothetical protein
MDSIISRQGQTKERIWDQGQDWGVIECKQPQRNKLIHMNTTYKNSGTQSKGQT